MMIYVCNSTATTGGHPICVCVYHQNVKLMLDACKFPTDQHSMTQKIVCSCSNQECPGLEPLCENLLQEFEKTVKQRSRSRF